MARDYESELIEIEEQRQANNEAARTEGRMERNRLEDAIKEYPQYENNYKEEIESSLRREEDFITSNDKTAAARTADVEAAQKAAQASADAPVEQVAPPPPANDNRETAYANLAAPRDAGSSGSAPAARSPDASDTIARIEIAQPTEVNATASNVELELMPPPPPAPGPSPAEQRLQSLQDNEPSVIHAGPMPGYVKEQHENASHATAAEQMGGYAGMAAELVAHKITHDAASSELIGKVVEQGVEMAAEKAAEPLHKLLNGDEPEPQHRVPPPVVDGERAPSPDAPIDLKVPPKEPPKETQTAVAQTVEQQV